MPDAPPKPPSKPPAPRPVRASPAPAATAPRRRAALIASGIALPVTVLLALAFTVGRGGTGSAAKSGQPLPAVSVANFPIPASAIAPCAKVEEKLPIKLNLLLPRVARGPQFVVAWGNPAVVYRCGVARPAGLTSNSGSEVIDTGTGAGRTVEWFPVKQGDQTAWTSIDRSVYIEVTVPTAIQGGEVISTLSGDIAAALPAVCQAFPANPPTDFKPALEKSLCVNRK